MIFSTDIKFKIKAIRNGLQSTKMSQSELGNKIGTYQKTISHIEAGIGKSATFEILAKMIKININLNWVFGDDDSELPTTLDNKIINDRILFFYDSYTISKKRKAKIKHEEINSFIISSKPSLFPMQEGIKVE